MTIEEFKTALAENLTVPVYHVLAAPEEECPVLCWQQLPTTHLCGDDMPIADIIAAQLDYYTETEYDSVPGTLEKLLQTLDTEFTQNELTYDNERAEWRYIWTVRFLDDPTEDEEAEADGEADD